MPALALVRDAIARCVLGDAVDAAVRAGAVTLRPHQREALRLVREAIAEFGGALLADEPGLGKTYVALALAREYASAVVIAPAALRGMWRDAAARADAAVTFHTFETLSRRDVPARAALVIVDEAHHACNPLAARYVRLARLATGARMLLLSATPVRNRRAELDSLLALFLGPRAAVLDEATRSRCIIRRGASGLEMPRIAGTHWHAAPHLLEGDRDPAPNLARGIAGLPPPLPALDGREARALLAMTLARCWASSLAALDAALGRRLQRGAALDAVLQEGRVPTRRELRAWVLGDDAMQLAFPLFVARADADTARLRLVLREHLDAVRAMRARIAPLVSRDADARAALLVRIAAAHRSERIVAFTSYRATAEALYRALRRRAGVALLTARGARTAGGMRPREDVLRALGPRASSVPRSAIDDISLVLATDVLSEGVNLQGASVVMHLDIPWTPAGLDQRVGRAARIGSEHAVVHVHGITAPAGAERLLALERRLARKHGETRSAARPSVDAERLRQVVARWRASGSAPDDTARAAAVLAARRGFLAVVRQGSAARLVGGIRRGTGAYDVTDDPSVLVSLAEVAGETECGPDPRALARACAAVRRWTRAQRVRTAVASGDPATNARRALLERLDRTLLRSAADARASLAARIRSLRTRAEASVGAGTEHEIRELARMPWNDPETWLGECERRLACAPPRAGASADQPTEPTVVLLLERDGARAIQAPPTPGGGALADSRHAAILEVHKGNGEHEVPDRPQRQPRRRRSHLRAQPRGHPTPRGG